MIKMLDTHIIHEKISVTVNWKILEQKKAGEKIRYYLYERFINIKEEKTIIIEKLGIN